MNDLSKQATQKLNNRRLKKRWGRFSVVLASIVVFCTVYALILPAITMSNKLICTTEEHTHTDDCYKTEITYPTATSNCSVEAELHKHTEECYNENDELICEQIDFVIHTHDDNCFDENGNMPCTLPEIKEHIHNEDCNSENELLCSQLEIILHTHDDACYDEEENLICDKLEIKEHQHQSDCMLYSGDTVETKTLICEKQEHTHTDDCYGSEEAYYYCGLNEHEHSEYCNDSNGELVCDIIEHKHTDSCKSSQNTTLTYSDSSMEVTLLVLGEDELPEDAELVVTPITESTDSENYDSMLSAVNDEMNDTTQSVSDAEIYDMKIMSDGEEYELSDQTTAIVDAEFTSPVFSVQDINDATEIKTFSLTSEEDEESEEPVIIASAVADEYKNPDVGVTAVSLTMNEVTPFAVALAAETVADNTTYWQKVTEIDDSTAEYLILSSGTSNYAFGITQSSSFWGTSYSASATQVTLAEVSGNAGYYTVTQSSDGSDVTDSMKWTFSATGTSSKQSNVAYSNYYLRLNNNNNTIVSTTSTNNTVAYTESSDAFRISYTSGWSNYYLRFSNNNFSRSTSTTGADLIILKAVDSLPNDSGSSGDSGNTDDSDDSSNSEGTVTKPEYDAFIEVSDSKNGSRQEDNLTVNYASDPATSQIENEFREEDYATAKEYDGKVLTDKSVLYMDDDYSAFDSYEEDTFSVTLSALGQQFALSKDYEVSTPIDVVFVLDSSGSMIANSTDGETRAEAMVSAVNSAMDAIYELNSENRVGVVCFSGQATTLLELGKYSIDSGEYLTLSGTTSTSTLKPNTNLTSLDGKTYRGSFAKWYGTYTQHGIAKGAGLLTGESNTTYNGQIAITDEESGEVSYAPYSVQRKPIIILLSDGDPTYCTSTYNDVLNSSTTIYGNGQAGNPNNKGILGYYTILSANYYKNQISQHYKTNASFYTIGMGISETGTADSSGSSATGDHYKRAVLNPTTDNISDLTSTAGDYASTTSNQMYKLLNNTFTSSTVSVTADTNTYTQYGVPKATSSNVPVIKNPYITSGYSYADQSYFSQNMTTSELTQKFKDIINMNADLEIYGFILRSGTSVEITDPIGEGMELKSEPILRYWGQEYKSTGSTTTGNVTTYTYEGTYTSPYISFTADISEITVTVTKEDDGTQTVKMFVPYKILPVYAPNISSKFYYEALPVRLIYQVGLTEESEQAVENLKKSGGTLTYYTNEWQGEENAFSDLQPTDENEYYQAGGNYYSQIAVNKSVNETNTSSLSWSPIGFSADENEVGHLLGNNGVLTFAAQVETIDIPVEKVWADSTAETLIKPVVLRLYRSSDGGATVSEVTEAGTIILNDDNNWQSSWTGLEPEDDDGNAYKYYVIEDKLDGFNISYSNAEKIIIDGNNVTAGAVTTDSDGKISTVTVTNTPGTFVLPATGSSGNHMYVLAGLLLIFSAICLYIKLRFEGRKTVSR